MPDENWVSRARDAGLNCFQVHVVERLYRGGVLRYGFARAEDGYLWAHVWLVRDGEIVDLFGWTDHQDHGEQFAKRSEGPDLAAHLRGWGVNAA